MVDESIYSSLSKERKQLQKKGEAPEWYTTGAYQAYTDRYQYKDQTPKGAFQRLAKTGAQYAPKNIRKDLEESYFRLFWEGKLAPSSPVLANMGTDRGLSVSCSGNYVEDSIEGFYSRRKECAILTKQGFGTSSFLGDIRERGSLISKGGTASGILPVLKGFVQDSIDVSQAGIRRGSWAGYMDIEHGDFWEIVGHLQHLPDSVNIGWIITDKFIAKLNKGDPEAIARYQRSLKVKCLTGKGYYFFVDKVNRMNPQCYKDLGLTVKASNLCVVPETKILTSEGHKEIGSLVNQEVDVWNGEEFSTVTVKQTAKDQPIVKVTTKFGKELECTKQHGFYVQNSYKGKPIKVEAQDLKVGDKLIKFDLPIIEGHKDLESAYTNGFFTGDGCHHKGTDIIYLYHDKRELLNRISSDCSFFGFSASENRISLRTNKLLKKYFIPDNSFSIESRLAWLSGYLDADGTVAVNGSNQSLQAATINKEFAKELVFMLQTLGVNAKICKGHDEGFKELPKNDGTGENKEYWCKEVYRVIINSSDTYNLQCLGLSCSRLKLTMNQPQRSASRFDTVLSVEDEGRVSDTFCFTEQKRNMGMFNGILTSNCTEITLNSDEHHTFTCVLSSLNAAMWDHITDLDIRHATYFLDGVCEDFIQKGSKIAGLEDAIRSTEKGRALGLGMLGFHTYLQSKGLPMGSMETHMLNNQMFKRIHDQTLIASQKLAEIYGEPEWCKGHGIRNTHRTALAPNMTSSILCGGVSQSAEPSMSNAFTQKTAAGQMERINPVFLELAKKRDKYTPDMIQNVAYNKGSVQHLDWLSEEEKNVFKTAYEIDQAVLLRLASVRQQHICQAQSLNLFFSADESEEYISDIHRQAFLDPNIKSLYYLRSEAGVTASKGECESCSG